jgi:hypothetical protein
MRQSPVFADFPALVFLICPDFVFIVDQVSMLTVLTFKARAAFLGNAGFGAHEFKWQVIGAAV